MNRHLRAARARARQAEPPRRRYLHLVRQPDAHGGAYWTWHGAGRWTTDDIARIHQRAAEMAAALAPLIG